MRIQRIACLFGLFVGFACKPAFAQLAELVWIENAKSNSRIYYSTYSDEQWSPPIELYRSKNSLTSPAIDTDSRGHKIVLWSEVQRGGVSRLYYLQKSDAQENWGQARLFSSYGFENLGTDIVFDLSGKAWVFWSSNRGGYDDIVYVTGNGQSWSRPELVHKTNEVPDFLPNAKLNEQGNVEVSWRSYSVTAHQYIDAIRIFELDPSRKSGYNLPLDDEEEVSQESISLPGYLPLNSVAVLHFPHNVLNRSMRLNLKN